MMKNGNAILFVSFHMKLRVYFKTSRERSTMMKNRNAVLFVSFEIQREYFKTSRERNTMLKNGRVL